MNFQKEVLDVSEKQPVLVDFWAPWCGPCQVLGPSLEQLESEQDKWKLVKVNVDENQQISEQFGIRGIPDVRLYHRGKEVSRFTGALPKHQIEKWLQEHIPDERLATLQAILKDEEIDKLRAFVKNNEDLQPGRLALAKQIVLESPQEAISLVDPITITNSLYEEAESVRQIAEFLSHSWDGDSNIERKLSEAQSGLRARKWEDALKLLIEAVVIDKSFSEDLPRKITIAIFNFLGVDHELTKSYRKRFDMALY